MSQTSTQIALCAASLASTDKGAPEWVHLLPAVKSGQIETNDKRGPYSLSDIEQLIETSMQAAEGRLPIDENHATDLAAPRGEPAPARGWIVELQSRADGVWGRVEWTDAGRELVESHAYRAMSPALSVEKVSKRVKALLRASLVNKPNLRGLAALHQEEEMTFQQKLAELLGLGADASEDDITAALEKAVAKKDEGGDDDAMPKIAKALNLAEDADAETVLNALEVAPKETEITELQSQIAEVTTELNSLKDSTSRKDAETFVDAEIARGRAGLKPVRERYVALHMKDPAEAEALIGAMPVLTGTVMPEAVQADGGSVSLNAEQVAVAAQLGMSKEEYAEAVSADEKEAV